MKNTLEKIVTYLKGHRPVAICSGSILALVFVVCIIVAVISNSNKDSVVDAQIPSVNTESQNVAVNTPTTESEKNSVQTELPETNATESQQPVETQVTQETQVPTETQVSNETQGTQVSSETQKQDSSKEPVKEPEKKPEKQPEKEPEKKPEKKPEKQPEKQPEKEPVKEPVKEPEKESEKEPEKTLQEIVDEYKASCVEVEWEKFRFYKGKGPDDMFENEIEATEILNYDYADGQKVNGHEYKKISTRWIYNGAGEKALFTGYYAIAEADSIWPMKEYRLDLFKLGLVDTHENDFGDIIANCEYCSKTKNRIVFVAPTCNENYLW